jgi:hypothetical protein
MSTTAHFAHVSADLQAHYLGTYLGHTTRAGRRYELWRTSAGILTWWGPPADGEPAAKLWTDPAPTATTDHHDALLCLWLLLGQPPRQPGSEWCPATP